jgi:hypothetical protein
MVPLVFMKRTICSVLSGYTFEQLDELDFQSIVEMFVQAEQIMLDAEIIPEPYQMIHPDELEKENQAGSIEAELGTVKSPGPAAQHAMREAQLELYRRAKQRADTVKKVG